MFEQHWSSEKLYVTPVPTTGAPVGVSVLSTDTTKVLNEHTLPTIATT